MATNRQPESLSLPPPVGVSSTGLVQCWPSLVVFPSAKEVHMTQDIHRYGHREEIIVDTGTKYLITDFDYRTNLADVHAKQVPVVFTDSVDAFGRRIAVPK